jgi:dihydrofolate reductase
MGRLIYSTQVSLDGFIEDRTGSFDFTAPDDEVHAFVNDSLRPIGTHLYGRRLYEVMTYWETVADDSSVPPVMRDFGRYWRAADKVVFSRTLDRVSSGRTTLERDFDPDAIRRRKAASDGDLLVGGADLAGAALRAGLVDEVRLFVFPVLVGGGRSAWGADVGRRLALREERRFAGGVVHLRYDVLTSDQGG